MEIGTDRLHELVRVSRLNVRREAQLFNMMFSFKSKNKFKKDHTRATRNADRFEFKQKLYIRIFTLNPRIIRVYHFGTVFR